MAENIQKRIREQAYEEDDEESSSNSNTKRQKPYDSILDLDILDKDEEDGETDKDLLQILTTLQQEISSSCAAEDELEMLDGFLDAACDADDGVSKDESVKSVMRHLLEASDDELGIPKKMNDELNGEIVESGETFPFGVIDHVLWELEDAAAAANFYSVLQSEFLA